MLIATASFEICSTPWAPSSTARATQAPWRLPGEDRPQTDDGPGKRRIECADDPDDDEEDLGDEEDLAVAQPSVDEESSFDDFDDDFDDDFEEEENDPDWDHPDDAAPEQPPPGKGGGRKK